MWGAFLSEPLRIVDTVGRYPAVYLMRRMPILVRLSFPIHKMPHGYLRGISPSFEGLSP